MWVQLSLRFHPKHRCVFQDTGALSVLPCVLCHKGGVCTRFVEYVVGGYLVLRQKAILCAQKILTLGPLELYRGGLCIPTGWEPEIGSNTISYHARDIDQ